MIEIIARDDDGKILAHMQIERLGVKLDDIPLGEYSVRVVVERGGGETGVHQRYIQGFPRLKLNVLALLKLALSSLGTEELELQDGLDPGHLARRQRRTREEIPREASSQVRHHRPAFWRRQQE